MQVRDPLSRTRKNVFSIPEAIRSASRKNLFRYAEKHTRRETQFPKKPPHMSINWHFCSEINGSGINAGARGKRFGSF